MVTFSFPVIPPLTLHQMDKVNRTLRRGYEEWISLSALRSSTRLPWSAGQVQRYARQPLHKCPKHGCALPAAAIQPFFPALLTQGVSHDRDGTRNL